MSLPYMAFTHSYIVVVKKMVIILYLRCESCVGVTVTFYFNSRQCVFLYHNNICYRFSYGKLFKNTQLLLCIFKVIKQRLTHFLVVHNITQNILPFIILIFKQQLLIKQTDYKNKISPCQSAFIWYN